MRTKERKKGGIRSAEMLGCNSCRRTGERKKEMETNGGFDMNSAKLNAVKMFESEKLNQMMGKHVYLSEKGDRKNIK